MSRLRRLSSAERGGSLVELVLRRIPLGARCAQILGQPVQAEAVRRDTHCLQPGRLRLLELVEELAGTQRLPLLPLDLAQHVSALLGGLRPR